MLTALKSSVRWSRTDRHTPSHCCLYLLMPTTHLMIFLGRISSSPAKPCLLTLRLNIRVQVYISSGRDSWLHTLALAQFARFIQMQATHFLSEVGVPAGIPSWNKSFSNVMKMDM